MTCETVYIDGIEYQKCDEFLFVYKTMYLRESVEFCRSQNYQLVKINNKQEEVDGIKKFINKKNWNLYFRLGLIFLYEKNTWSGLWFDGENYDETSIEDIQLVYAYDENKTCYEAIVKMFDIRRAFKARCGLRFYIIC